MDELLAYLDAINPLSPALRNHIATIMVEKRVPRKAFLFKAGRINPEVHFVLKGLIRCYHVVKINPVKKTKKEFTKWFFAEDDFIASRQSYDRQVPSREYYQALEPSLVLTSTFKELDNIYRQFPEFLIHGLVITGKYASQWYNAMDIQPGRSAKERYSTLLQDYPGLFQRVPLKYLASMLDLHESTISKIRKQ